MTINGDSTAGGAPNSGASKKQRIGLSSSFTNTDSSPQNETLAHKSRRFNDASTADVILRLHFDHDDDSSPSDQASDSSSAADRESEVQIYLHSRVLRRSKYFSALLSDRWQVKGLDDNDDDESSSSCENSAKMHRFNFNLAVPAGAGSFDHHLKVLEMLYSDCLPAIDSVPTALSILPIALELLFEDCIRACIRYLEAVPWSEDEEKRLMDLLPFLTFDEETKELVARFSPEKTNLTEEMLDGLIISVMHNHSCTAFAKAFVAKLLRDFTSRESARKVLDKAFAGTFAVVKGCLDDYSSPEFRRDHIETEARQRVNLHTAMVHGKHLLWLVERMVELRVADSAVKTWSEQASFAANLQSSFVDDAVRNIVPSLPAVVLRCTFRLASSVATGNVVAARQVRLKLVRDWLPVLATCKNTLSPMGSNHKLLYLGLEETFLSIISTLPMSDAQDLLQKCLSFSTRNVDDCPHLVAAFTTWFRRANGPAQPDSSP